MLFESVYWRPEDENDEFYFTQIPNCILYDMVNGTFKLNEIKPLIFIIRSSFGFKRERTTHIDLDYFIANGLHIKRSGLCPALKSLVDRNIIFRVDKNGNKYRYAINKYRYGHEMKYFKIVPNDYELKNKDSFINNLNYPFRYFRDYQNYIIVYNPDGYEKEDRSYIYFNRNINKNNALVTKTYLLSVLLRKTNQLLTAVVDSKNIRSYISSFEKIKEDIFYYIGYLELLLPKEGTSRSLSGLMFNFLKTILEKDENPELTNILFKHVANKKRSILSNERKEEIEKLFNNFQRIYNKIVSQH